MSSCASLELLAKEAQLAYGANDLTWPLLKGLFTWIAE